MSDINTPTSREHPEDPAEGADDASAQTNDTDDTDDTTPDDDLSSYNIEPPPTEDGEVPGVPDASGALEGDTEDEPGANATGVGA
jgi:hypothetical protein